MSYAKRLWGAPVVFALTGLALGACQRGAQNAESQPMTAAPAAALPLATAAPPPIAAAPPADALPPPSRPVRYAPRPPRERYQYINDAYAMSDAFGSAPPDYAVDYEGTRPWVWRSDNGAYRVVERLPNGERDYYYKPGADQPYFISDPNYSYAYDNGEFVAAYDRRGAALPDYAARERAGYAARYMDRAHAMHRAALNQPRQSAYAADWRERAPDFQQQRQQWAEESQQDADWRDWHDSHADEEQRRWAPEHDQRAAYTAALGAAVAGVAAAALTSHDHGDHNKAVLETKAPQIAPPAAQLATTAKPKTVTTNQSTTAPTAAAMNAPPHHRGATTAPPTKASPLSRPIELKKTVVMQKAVTPTTSGEVHKAVVVQTKTEAAPHLSNGGAAAERPVRPASAAGPHEHHAAAATVAPSHANVATTTTVAVEHPKHGGPPSAPPPSAAQEKVAEHGHGQSARPRAQPPKSAPTQPASKQPPESADKDKYKHKRKNRDSG